MYKERNPPAVWKKLGCFMHQDYHVCHSDFWSGVEEFWQSITHVERTELIDFLRHITEDELPGGVRKKYWSLSGAQILPSKIKPFLDELFARFESLRDASK